MSAEKAALEITGLTYTYASCVDPSKVTFEAFVEEDGHCGFTSLGKFSHVNPIVKFTGTPERTTATMNVTIDGSNVNEVSLGNAYSFTTGISPGVHVTLCVRASVESNSNEIVIFTEDFFELSYSGNMDFDTIESDYEFPPVSVDIIRVDDGWDRVVTTVTPIGLEDVTAYQCTEAFAVLEDPPALDVTGDRILRVCISGPSAAVECKNVMEAILTQSGNGNKQEKVVESGRSQMFTQIQTQGQTCMVKTKLLGEYFILKSANSTLDLVVSGTVRMGYASANRGRRLRRQLSEEPDEEAEKTFQVPASLMPETTPTTAQSDDDDVEVVTIMPATTVVTTESDDDVGVDAATGAKGIAAIVVAAITTMM